MKLTDLGLPISSSNASGLVISKQFFLPSLAAGYTYPLDTYAAFGYTVTYVYGLQLISSGSVYATFKIGSTAITGLNNILINSSTSSAINVTSNNLVAIGNTLSVVFGSPSSPVNIQFTLSATRT
jgi:hypothetical protein